MFQLQSNDKRKYKISVDDDKFIIEGKYLFLDNKNFKPSFDKTTILLKKDFLGIGTVKLRSYIYTIIFGVAACILEFIKTIIDKINDWIDKANYALTVVGTEVSSSGVLDTILNLITAICVILAVWILFAKHDVIEISFKSRRVCVPRQSMSQEEFDLLKAVLDN